MLKLAANSQRYHNHVNENSPAQIGSAVPSMTAQLVVRTVSAVPAQQKATNFNVPFPSS
jgi:hypothetical protein